MTPILGVLGGGQLGRMMAQAAAHHAVTFRFWDPNPTACAAPFGDHVIAAFDHPDAIDPFCANLDAATYEFENIPPDTVAEIAQRVPLRPSARSIELTQDRYTEKQFIRDAGAAPAPFLNVESPDALDDALAELGRPAVLKTRRFGYDGKGQTVIRDNADLAAARDLAASAPCVLEAFIDFTRELSVVAVRATSGETRTYPVTENIHASGILRASIAPAQSPPPDAEATAVRIAEALGHVGALCVEFFDTPTGLLVNEIAPRVHNSGHWTIDATHCSQFENHVRAALDMPLGETHATAPALMLNLISEHPSEADIHAIDPDAHVHLYGKEPRTGRKVGHITLVGDDLAHRTESLADLPGVYRESALAAAARMRVS